MCGRVSRGLSRPPGPGPGDTGEQKSSRWSRGELVIVHWKALLTDLLSEEDTDQRKFQQDLLEQFESVGEALPSICADLRKGAEYLGSLNSSRCAVHRIYVTQGKGGDMIFERRHGTNNSRSIPDG